MMMKRWSIFILILLLAGPTAFSKDLEVTTKAGGYDVGVRIDRNPPILGDNHIEIEIKDAGGKSITDANVLVNYYMPPMPRMAPMNYRTNAKLDGEKYRATMNFIMAGPWIIAIKITHAGKRLTAKFNVDAQ